MLPLNQQVSSLELSQKLKNLGVPQESYSYWTDENIMLNIDNEWKVTLSKDLYPETAKYISAFTVAELGEQIKKASSVDIHMAFMEVTGGVTSRTQTVLLMFDIEVVTKMLIYLLENKLINVEDFNK